MGPLLARLLLRAPRQRCALPLAVCAHCFFMRCEALAACFEAPPPPSVRPAARGCCQQSGRARRWADQRPAADEALAFLCSDYERIVPPSSLSRQFAVGTKVQCVAGFDNQPRKSSTAAVGWRLLSAHSNAALRACAAACLLHLTARFNVRTFAPHFNSNRPR